MSDFEPDPQLVVDAVRADLPWRVKHFTNRRSPLGARLPDRSYVYNRYGDVVAECPWGPDADYIAALAARIEQLEAALRTLADAGGDIEDMAPSFIDARDAASLRRYGANVQSIALAALREDKP